MIQYLTPAFDGHLCREYAIMVSIPISKRRYGSFGAGPENISADC